MNNNNYERAIAASMANQRNRNNYNLTMAMQKSRINADENLYIDISSEMLSNMADKPDSRMRMIAVAGLDGILASGGDPRIKELRDYLLATMYDSNPASEDPMYVEAMGHVDIDDMLVSRLMELHTMMTEEDQQREYNRAQEEERIMEELRNAYRKEVEREKEEEERKLKEAQPVIPNAKNLAAKRRAFYQKKTRKARKMSRKSRKAAKSRKSMRV